MSSFTAKTPGGLQLNASDTRTANLSNPNDIFSFTNLTDSLNVNGNVFFSVYDVSSKMYTFTSPVGRQETETLNSLGKVVSAQVAGLLPVNYGYDSLGRLNSIVQGSRMYTINYDSGNRISSIIDPMSRTISFGYDAAGRVTQETLPDGRVINLGYDPNSNVTSIVPPGKPAHTFDYTPVDLTKDYNPPALGFNGTTSYQYDLDRRPTETDMPYGSSIPPATNDLTESTGFTHDGSLLTSATWSGVVNGTVGYSYNNDFNVVSESLSVPSVIPAQAGIQVDFTYDKDGLLTNSGALSITRDPNNGLITGTILNGVSSSWSYSGYGEPSTYAASFNGTPLITEQYTRDTLGRITQKIETINGVTNTYAYSYDLAGRLTDVTENGATIGHYEYDSNGNHVLYSGSLGIYNGTYDAQDRLVSYGGYSYNYTNSGQLASKTGPNGTTQYGYDDSGNLVTVIQPDGTRIDYVIDGQNRRVGKEVNGVLVQGFLYEGQLRPVAELDGNGNIVAQFVYGTKINVPDYMIKNGETYRIITDHLGSPRLVVDVNTGTVMQQMSYDEFGNVVQDTNPGFQPFGFAGGIYDKDTGLVRFGARDYDPLTGRWTAKDPIRFAGGDTNLFSYVANDAPNWVDPFGFIRVQEGVIFDDNGRIIGEVGIEANPLVDPTSVLAGLAGGAVVGSMTGAAGAESETAVSSVESGASQCPITGYTKHGINSAISHDGVGVSPQAILDAVKNPTEIIEQAEGTIRYVGERAEVVLNRAGKVVTTWAKNHLEWR